MLIYYFSRTGRSKKIAEELAAKTQSRALPIADGKRWTGPFGFIRACIMTVRQKSLPARYEAPPAGDTVAVVFPVWASSFPPVVRTFIQELGRERIIAIPTSLGGTIEDRDGFARVIDLVGKEITAPETL